MPGSAQCRLYWGLFHINVCEVPHVMGVCQAGRGGVGFVGTCQLSSTFDVVLPSFANDQL